MNCLFGNKVLCFIYASTLHVTAGYGSVLELFIRLSNNQHDMNATVNLEGVGFKALLGTF
jgi:hypothetical protein